MLRSNYFTMALLAVAISAILLLAPDSARAVEIDWPEPGWPEIYEPTLLMTLNLEMDSADWDIIRYDTTYDIYKPAWFWADGEEDLKIKVAVRRKSKTALPDDNNPFKICLKIDINKYHCIDPGDPDYPGDPNAAYDWHGLQKLSLENSFDVDVVSEGLACNLHTLASGSEGYGYDVFRANWVILNINGVCMGVYVNNEQHDDQFLKHRGLYIRGNVWFYKQTGDGVFELQVEDGHTDLNSPAVKNLCYKPFVCTAVGSPHYIGPPCPLPNESSLAADMDYWVNRQGMLTMTAVDEFIANSDDLFNHYQNAFFLDFKYVDGTHKRMYFPWDQDSVMVDINKDIYRRSSGETAWQRDILSHPGLRTQYNSIMKNLLNGPLSAGNIIAFLNQIEPVLTPALAADPYNNFDMPGAAGVAERFNQIRAWITGRVPVVLSQVWCDAPPGVVLLKDNFDSTVFTNWTGNWIRDTATFYRGYAAAKAKNGNEGGFVSRDLDASDATAIHIAFKFRKDDTEEEEYTLYYYNGTAYNLISELDILGGDDVWLQYAHTVTDSQYFKSNFRIRLDGFDLDNQENVWLDDVIITKEAPMLISGYILDSGTPLEGVLVSADNGGGFNTTNALGYYEFLVPFNWSGTVTPTKAGCTFLPANKTYTGVTAVQPDQNYTAALLTYTISGSITIGTSGLAGVTMTGLPSSPVTDTTGFYSDTVGYDWSGTVTPVKQNYNFVPLQRTYNNVTADQTTQDYSATSIYDLNTDGSIGLEDLEMLCANWLNGGSGDFDDNGTADMEDFAGFAAAWLLH